MDEEIELAWLKLADRSELVLTRLHVFQQKNKGMFGEVTTLVPLEAMTAVRLSWQRSRLLLGAGIALLVLGLAMAAASAVVDTFPAYLQALLSSPIASFAQYGAMVGGVVIFVIFWFYKRNEIQIMASTETIGGIAKSYEEAQEFCRMLLSENKELPPRPIEADKKKTEEKKTEEKEKRETAETEWRL